MQFKHRYLLQMKTFVRSGACSKLVREGSGGKLVCFLVIFEPTPDLEPRRVRRIPKRHTQITSYLLLQYGILAQETAEDAE
jgi:hypothetical protein